MLARPGKRFEQLSTRRCCGQQTVDKIDRTRVKSRNRPFQVREDLLHIDVTFCRSRQQVSQQLQEDLFVVAQPAERLLYRQL